MPLVLCHTDAGESRHPELARDLQFCGARNSHYRFLASLGMTTPRNPCD
jgi:hypothetical protein